MKNSDPFLVQIMPAAGWSVVYADANSGANLIVEPLAMWGLFESQADGEMFRYVAGVCPDSDASWEPVNDVHNFLGYVGPGQSVTELYAERATAYLAEEAANPRKRAADA